MAFLGFMTASQRRPGRLRGFQIGTFFMGLWLLGGTDSPTQLPLQFEPRYRPVYHALLFPESQYLRLELGNVPEYQIKSVFLFNFAQFVEWPPLAFPDTDTPFTIGIWGEDPFGEFLNETVRDEKFKNRPFAIRHCSHLEDILACHILFINRSEETSSKFILSRTKNHPVLTVSDIPDFAQKGGVIEFLTIENKIRLRINTDSAKASGLTISSKMLSLADIVTPRVN